MRRLLTVILVMAMILSGTCSFAYAEEGPPENLSYGDRIQFITPQAYQNLRHENDKVIISWTGNVLKHFIYDLKWDDKGTDVYFVVDIEEKRNSSGTLLNGSAMPATILKEDMIQNLRIFDGKKQVPNDGLITFHEDGMATISREYLDKGYSLFIEADCCDGIHYHADQMIMSTGYGKGKVSQTPNCWYLDYDDIPTRAEDGSKLVYCLVPQVYEEEQPAYADAYSNSGYPDIHLTGECKSSNGYWVYPAVIPGNFDKTIEFIFEYGDSSSEPCRLFFFINPGTEAPADVTESADPIDPEKALERAKFVVKTSKVSSGTRVTTTIRGVNLEGLAEAGYTVKLKYYRSTKKSSGYKLMATRDLDKKYTNSKGTEGTRYYYKVRLAVYDENGELVAQTALKQSPSRNRTFKK